MREETMYWIMLLSILLIGVFIGATAMYSYMSGSRCSSASATPTPATTTSVTTSTKAPQVKVVAFSPDNPIEVIVRTDRTSPTGFSGSLTFALVNYGNVEDRVVAIELAGQKLYTSSGTVGKSSVSTTIEGKTGEATPGGIRVPPGKVVVFNVTLDPKVASLLVDLYPSTVRLVVRTDLGTTLTTEVGVRLGG